MIYLGQFSFVSAEDSGQPNEPLQAWHGHLTCIVEGDSVEIALGKFEAMLRRLHRSDELFTEVDNVHLDTCIEIKSIPKQGLLAYYNEEKGEPQPAISTSLFRANPKHATAYEWIPKDAPKSDWWREPFAVFESHTGD